MKQQPDRRDIIGDDPAVPRAPRVLPGVAPGVMPGIMPGLPGTQPGVAPGIAPLVVADVLAQQGRGAISSDTQGSYTGSPAAGDRPEQDADDL